MMSRIKTGLLALLVGLLIGSLALNVFLYRKARGLFALFQVTRFDPLNLGAFPEAESGDTTDKIRVVFFGDSRAAEWPYPEIPGRFAFFNRAIPGHTSTQSQLRYGQHVQPLQPDILVVQVCVNDLVTLGTMPEQYDRVIDRCRQNLDRIVSAARAQGSRVVLTTVFPLGHVTLADRLFYSDSIPAGITAVNQYIHSLAGDGVVVFDTAPILTGGESYVRDEYAEDWLHLNPAGYAALNEEFARLLLEMDA